MRHRQAYLVHEPKFSDLGLPGVCVSFKGKGERGREGRRSSANSSKAARDCETKPRKAQETAHDKQQQGRPHPRDEAQRSTAAKWYLGLGGSAIGC